MVRHLKQTQPLLGDPQPSKLGFDLNWHGSTGFNSARTIRFFLFLGLLVIGLRVGQADFRDSFETPETSWQLADSDCAVRVLTHRRSTDEFRSGHSSEYLRLSMGYGSFVHLLLPIPEARAISDFVPSIWVKSNDAGMQLMARVVFPRARFPQSQKTMVGLLRGQSYKQAGTWQQLKITDFDTLLQRETQQLRSKYGSQVDSKEAYIDAIVLNAYGRAGSCDLWIDDLELKGFAQPQPGSLRSDSRVTSTIRRPNHDSIQLVGFDEPVADNSISKVELSGPHLLAGGHPLMPRFVDWNGEPLDWLRSLGFNGVRFSVAPSSETTAALERLGMWYIAPAAAPGSAGTFGPRCVAIELGRNVTGQDIPSIREIEAQTRAQLSVNAPPLLVAGASVRALFEPHCDIVLEQLSSFASSRHLPIRLQMSAKQAQVLSQRPNWIELPSEPPYTLMQQATALAPLLDGPTFLDVEQLRVMGFLAVATGYRGFVFPSNQRLDLPDQTPRATMLHWMNEELAWVEPWCTGGTFAGTIPHEKATIGVWDTERGRLLVVVRTARNDPNTVGPAAPEPVTLVTRYSKNSTLGYRLAPHGMLPLTVRREAGGVRVTLEDAGRVECLLLTADPTVIKHYTRQIIDRRQILAKLRMDVLSDRVKETDEVLRVAKSVSSDVGRLESRLDDSRANIRQCLRFLEGGDYATLDRVHRVTNDQLTQIRWSLWEQSVPEGRVADHPGSLLFGLLPHLWLSNATISNVKWEQRGLPAGDFENLSQLLDAGWRQRRAAQADASAELSDVQPRGGRFSLKLRATGDANTNWDLEPAVTITSPPISVEQGQWLRIQGWIRIPTPLTQGDGALILDSVGGPALARRIYSTKDWERFTLYRAVTQPGELQLMLGLSSPGELYFDEVSVDVVEVGDKE